jgi:hypothetical protein
MIPKRSLGESLGHAVYSHFQELEPQWKQVNLWTELALPLDEDSG